MLWLQPLGKDQVQTAVPEPPQQFFLRPERPDASAPQTAAQIGRQIEFEAAPLSVRVDIGQGRILVREADVQLLAGRHCGRSSEAKI